MAGSSQYKAVLDANTLCPAPLRDLLLSLAVGGLYHARWTARIHEERVRNLTRNRPELEARLGALVELMNRSVPACLVENYEGLIAGMVLPDPDDRHVLAAAIAGRRPPMRSSTSRTSRRTPSMRTRSRPSTRTTSC